MGKEVDSVCCNLFLLERWTFCKFTTSYKFPEVLQVFMELLSFEWLLDQYWEVLNHLSEKFNSQEVFSRVSCIL